VIARNHYETGDLLRKITKSTIILVGSEYKAASDAGNHYATQNACATISRGLSLRSCRVAVMAFFLAKTGRGEQNYSRLVKPALTLTLIARPGGNNSLGTAWQSRLPDLLPARARVAPTL
jgi:hypothetical protein